MWDLNVNISAAADVAMTEPENLSGASPAAEESGSSTSSVVNEAPSRITDQTGPGPADDGESYSDASAAFIFDIMRKDEKAAPPGFVTRPFFPVAGNEAGLLAAAAVGPSISTMTTTPSRPQWLNLSFVDSGSGGVGGGSGGHMELRAVQQKQQIKKSRRGPRSRSSQYRGVTFYRRTGRWESHIWDCGKQVYLGGFDTAHAAARAYDRAAIKFRGVDADINFNVADYDEDMAQMRNLNKEEFVQVLRRQSTGFSRGSSKYRGVTLHKCGRWEARTGQFLGKKAYDNAAVKYNGHDVGHSAYQGEILIESAGGGEGGEHNLDLNLGISLPSKGNHYFSQDTRFRLGPGEVPNTGRPMVDGQPPSAFAVALNRTSASCSSVIHPNFLPRQEERRTTDINTQKRVTEGISSSARFSQWAWKIGGNGTSSSSVTATPVFAAAASSGFSAAAALPRSSHANFVPTLCLPSLPSAVTEHFQSQVRRS